MPPSERLDLETFLAELTTEPAPVLYVANPGNAGDALIAHATCCMFDRIGLAYEWVTHLSRTDPNGRVVLCGGGGNLIPAYRAAALALRWANGRAKLLILLPHTVDGHAELLAQLDSRTVLICREQVSYEYVRATAQAASCYLADDLAFSIAPKALVANPPPTRQSILQRVQGIPVRMISRSARRRFAGMNGLIRQGDQLLDDRRAARERGGEATTLHSFRIDGEQTNAPLPPDNLDLSDRLKFGVLDAEMCRAASYYFLRYLDLFDEVSTNRLHIAIGAALLGKQVRLHPNSYFKNRAVYEFSLREQFPNVEWVET